MRFNAPVIVGVVFLGASAPVAFALGNPYWYINLLAAAVFGLLMLLPRARLREFGVFVLALFVPASMMLTWLLFVAAAGMVCLGGGSSPHERCEQLTAPTMKTVSPLLGELMFGAPGYAMILAGAAWSFVQLLKESSRSSARAEPAGKGPQP